MGVRSGTGHPRLAGVAHCEGTLVRAGTAWVVSVCDSLIGAWLLGQHTPSTTAAPDVFPTAGTTQNFDPQHLDASPQFSSSLPEGIPYH